MKNNNLICIYYEVFLKKRDSLIKVGTDIIEVNRISESIKKYGDKFIRKVFTEQEFDYCKQYKLSDERFAGRFAGKESTQKALMATFPGQSFPLNKIEILNNDDGAPKITLLDQLSTFQKEVELEISISHIKEIATATTILVKK